MVLESCQDERYNTLLMMAPDPTKGWTNKGRRRRWKVMETGQRKGNGKGKLGTGLLT